MQNDSSKGKSDLDERLIIFAIDVIKFCESLKHYRFLWKVFDQIIDSATSTGANRQEARASSSKREFIKFFEIALKSANETMFWLKIILRVITEPDRVTEGRRLLQEAQELCNILGSSVLTLKDKK